MVVTIVFLLVGWGRTLEYLVSLWPTLPGGLEEDPVSLVPLLEPSGERWSLVHPE